MVSLSGGTVDGNAAYYYDPGEDRYKGVFIAGRTVTLSAFKTSKYETTYELWYEVRQWAADTARGANVYSFANAGREGSGGTDGAVPTTAQNEPVIAINWRDAVVWCNAYSEMNGKTPVYVDASGKVIRASTNESGTTAADGAKMKAGANGYRLPTEAEWEYAARGGGTPDTGSSFAYAYPGTNEETDLKNYAWYSTNSGETTHQVGDKKANNAGLYDMSGNVREWCWDWYSTPINAATNPAGPESGTLRIVRGGGFHNGSTACTVTTRHDYYPNFFDDTYFSIGFRVVCL
jgi:formylglycine-generating enzyme required for sulfatase activity